MKLMNSRLRGWGCILCVALVSGCFSSDPPTYTVSGKVLYSDDQPIPGGVVVLSPLESQGKANPRGMIGPDGSFTLKTPPNRPGAEAGKYRVMVQAFDPAYDDSKAPPTQSPPKLIHRKYEKFETSDLEVDVEPKDNEVTLRVDRAR
jgi:hypothetical protein